MLCSRTTGQCDQRPSFHGESTSYNHQPGELKGSFACLRERSPIARLWLAVWGCEPHHSTRLLSASGWYDEPKLHGINYRNITSGLLGASAGLLHQTDSTLISYWMFRTTLLLVGVSPGLPEEHGYKQDMTDYPEENRLIWNHCKETGILYSAIYWYNSKCSWCCGSFNWKVGMDKVEQFIVAKMKRNRSEFGSNSKELFIIRFLLKDGGGILFCLYQFISPSTDLVNGSQQQRNQYMPGMSGPVFWH